MSYIYLLVGGGSAGCVVANRLSNNTKHKVLLLEDGGDPNPILNIPSLFLFTLSVEPVYNLYNTEKQSNYCLENNGVSRIKILYIF